MQNLVINRPDDWHVHFRDHEVLTHTVNATAAHFARALIMPNLKPALTSISLLKAYHQRILAAQNKQFSFVPYLTLYLNEEVSPEELGHLKQHPFILGAKLYPLGATTNSAQGVSSIRTLYCHFDIMQTHDLVLQIHGEVTHSDIFRRESLFLTEELTPIIRNFPRLRIVLEHISTRAAVDFVTNSSKNVAATITPHHLLYNRNHLLSGGIKPHYYCLPILKHEQDQKALQIAATSGNQKFFAGTDSAPHSQMQKENACGCAGIYSAPYAVAMYTQLFDELGKLNNLNAFMSQFGAEFYHLPILNEQIELVKQAQTIPFQLPLGDTQVVPVAAGTHLTWSVHEH